MRLRPRTDLELTPEQRLAMLIGDAKDVFPDADTRRRAWIEHRDEIQAELPAGSRPDCYYEFDLKLTPPATDPAGWARLMDRGLIPEAEAVAMEREQSTLAPHQAREFQESFSTPASILKCHGDLRSPAARHALQHQLDLFTSASRFHAWRKRPALAEKYLRLAEAVAKVLATTAPVADPKTEKAIVENFEKRGVSL